MKKYVVRRTSGNRYLVTDGDKKSFYGPWGSNDVNEATKYIQVNFPVFVKNLVSVMELVVNYLTTMYNFILFYTSQFIDFVGTQLLNMKNGELEKAFLDTFKLAIEFLANQLQQLNKYLNQK